MKIIRIRTIFMIFLMILSISLGSCASGQGESLIPTPTFTIEESYAFHIASALPVFKSYWNYSVLELSDALSASVQPSNFPMADFIIVLFGSGTPISEYEDNAKSDDDRALNDAVKALVPLAEQVSSEGYEVLALINMVEPPFSVRIHHETLANCISWRIKSADSVLDLINLGIFNDAGSDECRNLESALGSLEEFSVEKLPPNIPIPTLPSIATQPPEMSPTPEPTVTPEPEVLGCIHWDEISLDSEGETLCAYGVIKRWFQTGEISYVAIFTEEMGTFEIIDYTRTYPEFKTGTCVMVEGEIEILRNVRPFIDAKGTLSACEPYLLSSAEETARSTRSSESTSVPAIAGDQQVVINGIVGAGDLETESVRLLNAGNEVSMAGWTLDDGEDNMFNFPDFILYSSGAVDLHSRAGTNTTIDLYWGLGQAVWTPGKVINLRNGNGDLITSFKIPAD